jgi:LmbE family N-acetylglucosaminyl deacetylase
MLRQNEARLALSYVGVSNVEFLKIRSGDYIIDQQLFERLPEAVSALDEVIGRVRPQALLTLAYEGTHPDHDSCNFITSVVAREHSLSVWEMPVYKLFHNDNREFRTFIPRPEPAISLQPTADEVRRKHQALAAYVSQGNFLLRFDSAEETFRPLPEYDYAQLPHDGLLNYEAWQWPMTGKQVCAAFEAYLSYHSALNRARARCGTKLG